MTGKLFYPLRLNAGNGAGEEARGFHQFCRHHPSGGAPTEGGPGPNGETGSARPLVVAFGFVPVPDVGKEAGEDCPVHLVRTNRPTTAAVLQHCRGDRFWLFPHGSNQPRTGQPQRLDMNPQLAAHLPDLGDNVAPLPVPQIVEELCPAHASESVAGKVPRHRPQVAPHIQEGDEVRGAVGKPCVRLIRLLLELCGPFPNVLDGEGGDDNEDLGRAT